MSSAHVSRRAQIELSDVSTSYFTVEGNGTKGKEVLRVKQDLQFLYDCRRRTIMMMDKDN